MGQHTGKCEVCAAHGGQHLDQHDWALQIRDMEEFQDFEISDVVLGIISNELTGISDEQWNDVESNFFALYHIVTKAITSSLN